ncbi:MAG: phosphate propanoyltransferase [Clostridia bacterium]|nr:phosphate propanoyltransferase [Clostridia bacterium]
MANTVLVETSARHVHLSEADIQTLFGVGHELTVKKMLSQPGQFACEERVDVVGPKNTIKNVSVLGPARKASQVEVSLTDARTLGISVPVRESGDLKGSSPVKLVGPAGEVELTEGAIAAQRHVHLTPETAEKFGVSDKEIVLAKLDTPRALIFDDVVIRVSPSFADAMHIDTDESNAANAFGSYTAEIIKK